MPILHIHGDSDTVVPLEKNAGELVRRYRELGGPAQLIVVPGKGHEVVPELFQSQAFVDWILRTADGPIAHYTFDEDGERALDASGNGHDGTLLNDARRVSGAFGKAIELDDVRQAISIPSAESLKPRDAISMSAWVSPSSLAGVHHIYRKAAVTATSSPSRKAARCSRSASASTAPIASSTRRSGRATSSRARGATSRRRSTDRPRVFLDGRQIASMPAEGPIGATGSAPGFVGADKGAESFFAGKIDDLRIYARALGADEVRALYEEAPEAIRRAAE